MSMNGQERLIVGATATLTVGSFMLSSIATQDAQLSGETDFNPHTQKPIIALGWVATGATGIAAGMWAKNRSLTLLGAAIAVGGLAWTYLVSHPVFNKDKAKAINGTPTELQSGAVIPY